MAEKKELTAKENKLLRQMYWRSFTLYSAVTPASRELLILNIRCCHLLTNFIVMKKKKSRQWCDIILTTTVIWL